MKQTKKMVLAALFAALCCVATMIIEIPTPGTMGYIHPGDGLVLLSGIILGPLYGGLAAGIGSMFADVFAGYAMWAPGTFIIKALCAVIAALLFRKLNKAKAHRPISYPVLIFSSFIAELFMVIAYLFYGSLLTVLSSGNINSLLAAFTSALASVPANLLQGLVAIILTCLLIPVFMKVSEIRSYILNQE